MALGDLFKSQKERDKDQQRKRRKAFRDAESAVDTVKDRVVKLKKERDKSWAEAKQYLRDGQKAAAQRSLQSVRSAEMMGAKLEMKRWVFEQLITKLELAKTDQEFAGALSAINTVVNIDPDAVADVLGEVEDKLGDQVDTDKIWEKAQGKEMEGIETQMTDKVLSIEEMAAQLQDEVAADMDEGKPAQRQAAAEGAGDAKAKIGEGRKRLKDLLENDK